MSIQQCIRYSGLDIGIDTDKIFEDLVEFAQ